ncbi:MAG: AAA-like domain-containing protein [Xenococcus sp. (in: cyanobacteria)]
MNASEPVTLDPILAYKLSSMRVIKQSGELEIASCELYRQYFTQKIQQHFNHQNNEKLSDYPKNL